MAAPFYEEHFAILDDPEYLYGLLLIENQIASSPKGAEHLEPRLFALVEEGKPEPESDAEKRWRSEYASELEEFWGFNKALADSRARGIRWAAERAELSESEDRALRLWLAGDDVKTIARTMNRQQRTVETLLERGQKKLGEIGASRARALGASP